MPRDKDFTREMGWQLRPKWQLTPSQRCSGIQSTCYKSAIGNPVPNGGAIQEYVWHPRVCTKCCKEHAMRPRESAANIVLELEVWPPLIPAQQEHHLAKCQIGGQSLVLHERRFSICCCHQAISQQIKSWIQTHEGQIKTTPFQQSI
jgi:hypothetical protein